MCNVCRRIRAGRVCYFLLWNLHEFLTDSAAAGSL